MSTSAHESVKGLERFTLAPRVLTLSASPSHPLARYKASLLSVGAVLGSTGRFHVQKEPAFASYFCMHSEAPCVHSMEKGGFNQPKSATFTPGGARTTWMRPMPFSDVDSVALGCRKHFAELSHEGHMFSSSCPSTPPSSVYAVTEVVVPSS